MRTPLLTGSIFSLIFTAQLQAQYKSIDEMKIEKIGIDCTLKEFLKVHPEAKLTKTDDSKYGVKTYVILDPDGGSYSSFSFLDDSLVVMLVQWTKQGLRDAGGWEPITNKIVSKYGKADPDSPGVNGNSTSAAFRWATDKCLMGIIIDEENGLSVCLFSKKLTKQLNELKAKKAKAKIDD